ncbi:MAG TPA: hypothetical protein VF064_08075, partial [Pyrinomonadaceae bacterium]
MSHPARLSAAALCLLTVPFPHAAAQQATPPAQTQKAPPATAAKKKPAAADPLAEVRRQSAISLVVATADEANRSPDRILRARVQARAADVMWDADRTRAKMMFRNAWRAAVFADEEAARLTDEERRRRETGRASTESRELPSMRREVLRLAARRDAALAQEFLAEMEGAPKPNPRGATASAADLSTLTPPAQTQYARINPDNPPPAMMQRLGLARQILEDGDADRAMQFADPALFPVNTYGMNILDMLREKNAAAADERFGRLLLLVANDPQADANTVSLLSSYVLTPYLYITVNREGASHTRRWRRENAPPADLPAPLRDSFLRTAAQILLRPLPPADQDLSSAGRIGTYTIIARLAQVYERLLPDVAATLRARQSVLMQDVPENNRRPDDPLLSRGLVPEAPSGDRVQEALDRLPNAKTADERDMIHYRAAMAAAETEPDRAREFVNKIEDIELRRQLFAFLAFQAVERAIRDKRAEDVVRLSRGDELNSVQRTWALTEAARLFTKDEPGRALEVLDDATNEARKIDQASPDRARALVAIVTQLHKLDRPRTWEVMNEVVKASNSLPAFSGEDGGLTVRVRFKGGGAMTTNFNVESFDLAGVFDSLAREDFNRAADLSKALTGEQPRAAAALAAARAVLDQRRRPGADEE